MLDQVSAVLNQAFLAIELPGGRGVPSSEILAPRIFDAADDATAEFFDVFGKPTGKAKVARGLSRIEMPVSGYACITR